MVKLTRKGLALHYPKHSSRYPPSIHSGQDQFIGNLLFSRHEATGMSPNPRRDHIFDFP